ncbi:hypothetical protein COCVIDRAFT_20277 [Bipolaris victoriae FI3]|uniref:HTH CENPB-type domain-containing protein n=1 Tax=Bipolaris victoriae (strain FI3) TaxID=930091 RepID=W7ECN0_BIPV3|nr:hypothetical protein COCVIDRAFT_20277 [Bipolaris victoriae FI3]
MDPASQALAQRLPKGVRDTCAARSEHGDVPISTLIHRRLGRRSRAEQAQSQQYLPREEEKALVKFLLLMSSLGQPVRVKYLRSLAFSIARQRSTKKSIKRLEKNWPRAFEKRHPELQARRHPCVLLENVYNIDETRVMLSMLGSTKVLVGKDDRQGIRGAGVKRTIVTAIECISADGRALLPLIIWPASTHRSNWTTHETPGWHYAHSENGYNDSKISLEWLKHIVSKEHFTYLYSSARDRALTKRNIRAGWSATGLFPFNPERVLRDLPKPPAEVSNILALGAEIVSTDVLDDVLDDVPRTPTTPVTTVTTEALTTLHDLIIKDTHALEKTISFAEQALLKDRNYFFLQINREAKTRQSTKSVVLGKAKVMNFEDLEEARAKRAAKEHVFASKPKRGRKRKSDALEGSTVLPSPKPKVLVVQQIDAPELTRAPVSAWRAPVARMY